MTDYNQDGEIQDVEIAEDPREGILPAPIPQNTQVATTDARSMQVFNPLDANTTDFKAAIAKRNDNFNQLREYLKNALVPDKDFGKIHVAKNCDNKYNCTKPGHFSGYTLFDPGADKILGIMGLGVMYDDIIADYRRALLKGITVEEIIITAKIVSNVQGQVIAEGIGSCSLKERSGSFNNALKIAQKRARLAAVARLPGVSALFDSEFFDSIVPAQRPTYKPSQTRAQRESEGPRDTTGKVLERVPYGKNKGKRFSELSVAALRWYVDNNKDKPDMVRSCEEELQRRALQDDTVHTSVSDDMAKSINQRTAPPPLPPVDTQNELSQTSLDDEDPVPPHMEAHRDFLEAAFGKKQSDDKDLPPLDAY